ncbi:DUF397 domain-containing protein [Streptomyces sp. NPDC058469]|uniref:DUF397 domain-containing protein n=1 Tax=Streptomyces sp. NPDC058469 TaxID=3346514 RepID=UPI003660F6B6
MIDLSEAKWTKASASQANGDCVEVAFVIGAVAMRDSKNPDGAVLVFTPGEWATFKSGVQAGEFDL